MFGSDLIKPLHVFLLCFTFKFKMKHEVLYLVLERQSSIKLLHYTFIVLSCNFYTDFPLIPIICLCLWKICNTWATIAWVILSISSFRMHLFIQSLTIDWSYHTCFYTHIKFYHICSTMKVLSYIKTVDLKNSLNAIILTRLKILYFTMTYFRGLPNVVCLLHDITLKRPRS